MALVWTFFAVTTILLVGRIYVRLRRNIRNEHNDWALWLALASYVSNFTLKRYGSTANGSRSQQ